MNSYIPGQGVLVTATFLDGNGVPLDPTTVTLKYRQPDATPMVTVSQGSLTHASIGVWQYTIDTTGGAVGDWHYKFEGTGVGLGAAQSFFTLRRSQVA